MTTLVLFHSALGLRPAVSALAERFRAAGHTVHTPDLFLGEVYDDLGSGTAARDRLGIPELLRRASASVADLPREIVYGGLSMGTAAAQQLVVSRPGARGALLLHGALPLELFGAAAWPAEVPAQLHVSPDDPWVDPSGVDAFAAAVPDRNLEVVDQPGTGHLFTDPDHPDHDATATARSVAAASRFLARCDGSGHRAPPAPAVQAG